MHTLLGGDESQMKRRACSRLRRMRDAYSVGGTNLDLLALEDAFYPLEEYQVFLAAYEEEWSED